MATIGSPTASAICQYLERKHPTPSLFPTTAEDIGRMTWFEEFNDTLLVPAADKVFFQLRVRSNLFKVEPDTTIVDHALTKELPPLFDYLESQISGAHLVGGKLTLADIAIHCPFVNLKLAGHPVDGARWPKVARYAVDLMARPAFARVKDPS